MTNPPNEVTDAEAQEVLRQLGREYSHSVIGDCKRAINRILQARSATSDAAMLDWMAVNGSFGIDSVTGEVGGNGQKRKAATRKNIDAAIAAGGSQNA